MLEKAFHLTDLNLQVLIFQSLMVKGRFLDASHLLTILLESLLVLVGLLEEAAEKEDGLQQRRSETCELRSGCYRVQSV